MLLVCIAIIQLCVFTMQELCADSHDPFPGGKCEEFRECVYNEDGGIWQASHPIRCDDRKCCGTHFSTKTLSCVHPDEALCLPNLRELTCANVSDRLSHPTNCSRYFECHTMRPNVTDCPDNMHFSSRLKMCVSIREAQCERCDKFSDPMRPTLLPDPKNCAAFFKCHNGQLLPMNCPHNLYFSIERDRCEFPFTVNCTDGVRPKD